MCCGNNCYIFLILLIFGSNQTVNDDGKYVGDGLIKLFINADDDAFRAEETGRIVFDLVTEDSIKNHGDNQLINETILVNITNLDTNETKEHNLTYNYAGDTAITEIELHYGKYHVSAYFPGNSKYASCSSEADIILNDDTTLHSKYTGDYELVSLRYKK